jgi:GT2 family glycosyltransferase
VPPAARVCVILTSHNRRQRTIECIVSLRKQRWDAAVDVILVDAGSGDGTPQAIRGKFPDVTVLDVGTDVYWAGGMRIGMNCALRSERYDYYLWLNDDVLLEVNACARLLQTACDLTNRHKRNAHVLVCGALVEPGTIRTSYSGLRSRLGEVMRWDTVDPGSSPVRCDSMNGNVVLIPDATARLVGNIDPALRHAMGDFDYGLRATSLGCEVWLAPGHVGSCARNAREGTWQDPTLPLRTRWRLVMSPTGLPLRDWLAFTRRYGGRLWPLRWISPYVHLVGSSVHSKFVARCNRTSA